MPDDDLTQLVGFSTALDPERFVEGWRPVAAGFLRSGLATITLAVLEGDGDGELRYVSRNSWPGDAYRRAFPTGLAADGGAGRVEVVQAGAFTVHAGSEALVAVARPALDLGLALVRLVEPRDPDAATEALLAALGEGVSGRVVAYRAARRPQRFDVALTVHGPAGSGAGNTAALREAAAPVADARRSTFVTGRELLSLAA